jgi:hypothetical protein
MRLVLVSICSAVIFVVGVYLVGKQVFRSDYVIPDVTKESKSTPKTTIKDKPSTDNITVTESPETIVDDSQSVTPFNKPTKAVIQDTVKSPMSEPKDSSESTSNRNSEHEYLTKLYFDARENAPQVNDFATYREYVDAFDSHTDYILHLLKLLQEIDIKSLKRLSPAELEKAREKARQFVVDNHSPEDVEDFDNFVKENFE